MKKPNIISVCIGIATYNEEKNILKLLEKIDRQKLGENINVKKIIISDDSDDTTPRLIKNFKSRFQIELHHHNFRRGKMKALQEIVQNSNEEIIVLIDGDVIPKDENTINKIIQPFLKEKNIGIVAGNPLPYASTGFKGGIFSAKVTKHIKENINNGYNFYTVNGRILAVSRKVMSKILKKEYSNLIIDDGFIYLQCKHQGKKIKFIRDAVVYYKPPQSLVDFTLQRKRFEEGVEQLEKIFGKATVKREIHIPYKILAKGILTNLSRDLIGFINWALWFIYTKTVKRRTGWKYVSTTK